jgi:hypothetical protein
MPGSRHSYVTLVTSEFLAIIEEYLEFRRRQGKRVVTESPQKAEANRPHYASNLKIIFVKRKRLRSIKFFYLKMFYKCHFRINIALPMVTCINRVTSSIDDYTSRCQYKE